MVFTFATAVPVLIFSFWWRRISRGCSPLHAFVLADEEPFRAVDVSMAFRQLTFELDRDTVDEAGDDFGQV